MPETFNFRRSCELLQINPKSFQEWLKKAGIDPSSQVNKADPREKYLTKEQLLLLADVHGRTLPPLDEEEEQPDEAMNTEALAEQLTTAQQQNVERFDQIDRVLAQILALLQEIALQQHDLQALPKRITPQFDKLEHSLTQAVSSVQVLLQGNKDGQSNGAQKAVQQEPVPALLAPTSITVPPPPIMPDKTSATKRQVSPTKKSSTKKKKTVRGKKLPVGLVLLRDFASQHHIATERASTAGKSGKITVVQGKWLVHSRWATESLDTQGQHDFYEIFHEHRDFTPCERCPHSISQAS